MEVKSDPLYSWKDCGSFWNYRSVSFFILVLCLTVYKGSTLTDKGTNVEKIESLEIATCALCFRICQPNIVKTRYEIFCKDVCPTKGLLMLIGVRKGKSYIKVKHRLGHLDSNRIVNLDEMMRRIPLKINNLKYTKCDYTETFLDSENDEKLVKYKITEETDVTNDGDEARTATDDESRRAEPVGDDRKIHNVEEMRGGPAVLIQNTQNNVEAVRQEPEVINQNECLPSQPGTGGPVLNPGFLDSTPRLMIGSLDSDVCKNTTQPMNTNLPQVLPDDLVKAERCSKECGHIEFNELDPGTVSDRFRTREGPSGTSHLNEINNIEISLCILNSQNNEEEEIVKKTPVEVFLSEWPTLLFSGSCPTSVRTQKKIVFDDLLKIPLHTIQPVSTEVFLPALTMSESSPHEDTYSAESLRFTAAFAFSVTICPLESDVIDNKSEPVGGVHDAIFSEQFTYNVRKDSNKYREPDFHMLCLEDATKVPNGGCSSMKALHKDPPEQNFFALEHLDRRLLHNDSIKSKETEKALEEIDDCRFLRQITWLPVNQLPVPSIYTNIIVNGAPQVILDRIAKGEIVGAQDSMKFEILRLCTYRNYPSEGKPFRIQLASAGLYYASNGDEVVCYTCGLRRAGWNEKDKPLEIHKQIRSSCAFLVRNDSVNVPIPELPAESALKFKALEEIISAVDTVPVVQSQRSQDSMARHGNFDLNTSESPHYRFFTPPPKHPQYAVQSVRLESFKGWPTNIPQTPQIMAECGYYYAGFSDCVRCFHCGIGLRHWTDDDYPWVEHARWSKDCAYLRQMKGEEFIQNVHLAVDEDEEPEDLIPATPSGKPADMSQVTPNEESNQILLTDPAQSVLEMGYQPRIIKKAIDIILRTEGRSGISAQKIMETVFMLEDRESNLEEQVGNMTLSETGTANAASNVAGISQNTTNIDQLQTNTTEHTEVRTIGDQAENSSTVSQQQRNTGSDQRQDSSTSQRQTNAASGETHNNERDQPSKSSTDRMKTETGSQNSSPATSLKENNSASPRSSPQSSLEDKVKGASLGKSKPPRDTTRIKAENRKLKEQTICKVCLDKPVSIVFLPCGHLVTCAKCAPAMKKCPICRAHVKGSVRAFMS